MSSAIRVRPVGAWDVAWAGGRQGAGGTPCSLPRLPHPILLQTKILSGRVICGAELAAARDLHGAT